jgi:hypothetical protein
VHAVVRARVAPRPIEEAVAKRDQLQRDVQRQVERPEQLCLIGVLPFVILRALRRLAPGVADHVADRDRRRERRDPAVAAELDRVVAAPRLIPTDQEPQDAE